MVKFIFITAVILCGLFTGCRTAPVIIDANPAIIGGMDSVRQLRTINERALSIIADYDYFIERTAESLRDGALDVRTALARYDEFVASLIRRIAELEELSRGVDEEVLPSTDTSYYPFSPGRFEHIGQGLRLDNVSEGS
jgi:hypothetical protein